MNKYLKILSIFALLFGSMKVHGQGSWVPNPYEVYWFTDMVHSLTWLEQNSWWFTPCDGGGSGGPGGPSGPCGPVNPSNPSSVTNLTIMTYNIAKNKYFRNGRVIARSGADVCAVQEIVTLFGGYSRLKDRADMNGSFLYTLPEAFYGIAILWKPSLGKPTINTRIVTTPHGTHDRQRGFIIAEWSNFIVVSTHFPTGSDADKNKMKSEILNHNKIKCRKKPAFIAGDLNMWPGSNILLQFTYSTYGFVILNDTSRDPDDNSKFLHPTHSSGAILDYVLGCKKYPTKYNVIDKGIPDVPELDFSLSDHLPYFVKLE